MLRWLAGLALIFCLIAGCDQREEIAKITPKADADFAKGYIALFQTSDFAAIEAGMDSQVNDPELRPTLVKMAAMIPREPPVSIEVVGVEITKFNDGTSTTHLKFQYEFPEAWLVIDVVMKRDGERITVQNVYFTPIPVPLKELNAFSVSQKPLLSYLVLAASIATPTFMVVSLIACFVTWIPKRRWLWCILVFAGVASYGVNWTSGQVDFQLLTFGLLSSGFSQLGADGPYYFESCIPVGAIVFWTRRRKWQELRHSQASVF